MGLTRLLGLTCGYAAHSLLGVARALTGAEIEGMVGRRVRQLAYAENRWQGDAFLYQNLETKPDSLAHHRFQQIAGAPAGFINETDLRRLIIVATHIASGFAWNFVKPPLICVGVKHGNVSGAGIGENPADAARKMVDGDPEAIFGGYVLINYEVTLEIARVLRLHRAEYRDGQYVTGRTRRVLDGIIAPNVHADAMEYLERQDQRCRIITNEFLKGWEMMTGIDHSHQFSPVRGGFMTQGACDLVLMLEDKDLELVGEASAQQRRDMVLAWAVGSTANSNTIVLAKDGRILSVAVGNQSRVIASVIACLKAERAGSEVGGSVAYSDSFFPYLDAVSILRDKGVSAILTSSGPNEVKNQQIRDYCKQNGIALLMGPDALIRGFFGHGC